jgi:hypothetical protein
LVDRLGQYNPISCVGLLVLALALALVVLVLSLSLTLVQPLVF